MLPACSPAIVACGAFVTCGPASERGADDESADSRGSCPACAAVPARYGAGTADPGRAGRPGQGGPGRGAAQQPCGVRPAAGPARPDRPAGRAGQVARARAGAGPVRADDGVPVHLLPRGGAADGQRPGHHAGVRAGRAGLRRRAPVQLRHLRLGRAPPGLRRQRFRRDPARPVGVGRQAAGREPGSGRARQRVSRQAAPRDRRRHGRPLPPGDAGLRRDDQPGSLVRARGRRGGAGRAQFADESAPAQGARRGHGQGADQGQHAGRGQADPGRRRPAADHLRPAAARADR